MLQVHSTIQTKPMVTYMKSLTMEKTVLIITTNHETILVDVARSSGRLVTVYDGESLPKMIF